MLFCVLIKQTSVIKHARFDAANGKSVVEIIIQEVNNFTSAADLPSTLYNPTTSVIYHKPFGDVAIVCACVFTVSFLCLWPCVIVRGCCAKVRRACASLMRSLISIHPLFIRTSGPHNRGSAHHESTLKTSQHADSGGGVGDLFSKFYLLPYFLFS